MKIIITGATGTAGSEVLRQALADERVEKICVLSRRAIQVSHPKLTVVIHPDFTRYDDVLPSLAGFDACLWCLGASQSSVTPEELWTLTFDYAVAAARAMATLNENFVFVFLSSRNTDRQEQARVLFKRIKGRTETVLAALGKPLVYHLRPAAIDPINEPPKTKFAKFVHWSAPFLQRRMPAHIINAVQLAHGMLEVAARGYETLILENLDIHLASKRYQSR